MPLPSVWGPKLWPVLHAFGARGGKALVRWHEDERREILWLIGHLETIVPCPECRKHIEEYRRSNPLPVDARELGEWIWKFHEAVNERLGKERGPAFEVVLEQYQKVQIQKLFQEYFDLVKECVLKGTLSGTAVREWRRHLILFFGLG